MIELYDRAVTLPEFRVGRLSATHKISSWVEVKDMVPIANQDITRDADSTGCTCTIPLHW